MALVRTDYGLIYNTDGSLCATLLPEGGVAVTEETTNMIPVEGQDFSRGWYAYQGSVVTLTQNISVPEWKTTKATRIDITGGTALSKYVYTINNDLDYLNNKAFVVHVRVKNIGINPVRVHSNRGESKVVLPGETKLVILYVEAKESSRHLQLHFGGTTAEDELSFIVYQPGAEEKNFYTPFAEGTRPAGRLPYDIPQLKGARDFTLHFKFLPYMFKETDWQQYLFSTRTDNYLHYYASINNSGTRLSINTALEEDNTSVYARIDNPPININSWHRYVMTGRQEGDQATLSIYLDGVEVYTSTRVGTLRPFPGILALGTSHSLRHAFNGAFRELYICPYAVSPETIATWHSLDAPFYDPREITTAELAARQYAEAQAELARITAEAYADGRVTAEEQARIADAQQKLQEAKQYADQKAAEDIDASKRTIYAPGVIIDSTGAWGIANGVKQAGFGTDGRWVAGGGSVVADETGLKIISPNGDYSLMDANQLRFFKTGYDVPYWYAKRVTYGIAEDGDYIDLASETGVPWDQAPKVITAINSLISYNPTSSHAEQHFEAYVDGVTNEGFYVYCKNVIPATWSNWNDQNITLQPSYTTDYTPTSVTELEISINSGRISTWVEFPPMYVIYQHYIVITYQKLGGSWVTYFQGYPGGSANGNYADKNYTYHISGLEPGQYRVAVYGQTGSGVVNYAKLNGWRYRNVSTVNTGRVMWIAIEGGAN